MSPTSPSGRLRFHLLILTKTNYTGTAGSSPSAWSPEMIVSVMQLVAHRSHCGNIERILKLGGSCEVALQAAGLSWQDWYWHELRRWTAWTMQAKVGGNFVWVTSLLPPPPLSPAPPGITHRCPGYSPHFSRCLQQNILIWVLMRAETERIPARNNNNGQQRSE